MCVCAAGDSSGRKAEEEAKISKYKIDLLALNCSSVFHSSLCCRGGEQLWHRGWETAEERRRKVISITGTKSVQFSRGSD